METKLKQYEEELKQLQKERADFGLKAKEEANKLQESIKKHIEESNKTIGDMLSKELILQGKIEALKECIQTKK